LLRGATRQQSSSSSLSAEQVVAYNRDGYLVTDWRLEAAHLAAGRRAMDEILHRNPDVMPEQLVNAHLVGNGESTGDNKVKGCSEFLMLASLPQVVDMVAQCLGTDNVILWACQIFCKPAGVGKAVPFHQDGQYWPIQPLRACTAWIALDRSDGGNGALRVVPGTHRDGEVSHIQRVDDEACISYVADPQLVKPMESGARTLELEPGQVSIHDSMLLHGSLRNTSDRRRAGVAAAYMPAECFFNRHFETEGARKGGLKLDFSTRPLFVVKGSNQHPQNELVRQLV